MTAVLQYREPFFDRSNHYMHSSNFVSASMASLKKSDPYEGHSSGSESRRCDTPGTKRRPSRAGTRSVTTLSAAQLERKRANDREAQRAIRQRTKDHIADLERQIHDLTVQRDTNSSAKLMELMHRNEELEDENDVLRNRLSQAVTALGVPDQNAGNSIPGTDNSGLVSTTGGAPSPSDRVQMLSQPRRTSTGTPRSVQSVPDMSTPVSQPGHWQPQHTYPPNVSSPHVEASPGLGDVSGQQDTVRWNHHPHGPHHTVSMPVQDPSLHAMGSPGMSYPSPYGMDNQHRALSYPLENPQLVTSQPMQMTGYNTPTSTRSPHPSDYQRHMNLPMNAHPAGPQPSHHQQHHPHQHPRQHPQQQGPQTPYATYPNSPHGGFMPQTSHPGEMQPMMTPHSQTPMMGDQGHIIYQHFPGSMKAEHH